LGNAVSTVMSNFFALFFVKSVFGITVKKNSVAESVLDLQPLKASNINVPVELVNMLIVILLFLLLIGIVVLFFIYQKNRVKLKENEKKWTELVNYTDVRKSLSDMEVSTIQLENDSLVTRLEERKRELVTYSLNIGEQRLLLNSICKNLGNALNAIDLQQKNEIISDEIKKIKQKMSFTSEVDRIYSQADQVYTDFSNRLSQRFPNLTLQDRRLIVLLRIGFSSKEIAPILNISVKSVEISRYRLRKKLNLSQEESLTDLIKNI
ncbi:MAG: LuxR C-terminal-related transcriptional regulator, partial [Bacteroidales bacterium]